MPASKLLALIGIQGKFPFGNADSLAIVSNAAPMNMFATMLVARVAPSVHHPFFSPLKCQENVINSSPVTQPKGDPEVISALIQKSQLELLLRSYIRESLTGRKNTIPASDFKFRKIHYFTGKSGLQINCKLQTCKRRSCVRTAYLPFILIPFDSI